MPAPVPIQIRYGDNGVIGAAAAGAGAGAAFQRQKAMDMQLISQMLQNKVQASLQEDQQAHEDQLSNDAFAMQRAAQQPQTGGYYAMSDLSADPGSAMKQMSLDTARAAGVQGPELAILEGAASNKNINAAYFESMTDEMKKRAAAAKKTKDNATEKQAYLNSLGNTLPPEEMTKLKSLSESGDMDINQFRTSVGQSQSRVAEAAKQAEMEKKAIVQMNVSAVNDKIKQSEDELKAMEKNMQDAREKAIAGRTRDYQANQSMSYDEALAAAQQATPAGTSEADFQEKRAAYDPSFFAPVHAGLEQIGEWFGKAPTDPRQLTQAGDPMGLRSFIDIKKKKQEIDNLRKSRDQLISTLGPSPIINNPTDVKSMSNDQILQALGK